MRPSPSTLLNLCARTLLSVCAGISAGCVSVHITDTSGQTQVVRHVGYLQIQVPPGAAVTGSVAGVGLVGAPLGWSLGYTKQRWALLGRGCAMAVWLPDGRVDPFILQSLVGAGGACVLDADGTRLTPQQMETSH